MTTEFRIPKALMRPHCVYQSANMYSAIIASKNGLRRTTPALTAEIRFPQSLREGDSPRIVRRTICCSSCTSNMPICR